MVENRHRHVNIIRIVTPQRRGQIKSQTYQWPIDRPIDRLSIAIGQNHLLAYCLSQQPSEEQDPDAAGGGDWQGHDHRGWPGEVGGAGIGGLPQEETLIMARPPVEMQSKVLSIDGKGHKVSPQAPGYDPAACIHEGQSLAAANWDLRGGQGSEPPIRSPGAQTPRDEPGSIPRGIPQKVAEITSQSVHVAEIPGFQTCEPEPSVV